MSPAAVPGASSNALGAAIDVLAVALLATACARGGLSLVACGVFGA